jgi:hypothetical protein
MHCGIGQRFRALALAGLIDLAHRVSDLGAGGARGASPSGSCASRAATGGMEFGR